MADVPGPTFVLPSDFYIAPGISNSGNELSLGDPKGIPCLEAWAGASIVVLGLATLLLLIAGLVQLVRQAKNRVHPSWANVIIYLAVVVLAVLAFSIPILLTRVNNHPLYAYQSNLVRSFGVDRHVQPAAILAPVSLIVLLLFIVSVIGLLWAWICRRCSLRLRILSSLVIFSVVPLIYLGFRWDIFTMLI
jgi:hypothetical protein